MRVDPDDRLTIASRVVEWQGKNRLLVTVMGAFDFNPADPSSPYLPAGTVWELGGPVAESGIPLEEGFAKPGREFFVAGSAYAVAENDGGMDGAPASARAVEVSAQVGKLGRSLRVTGDRHWRFAGATEPKPFASMPVDWAHAWGGEEAPGNPLGKGMLPEADGRQPIPNVLDSNDVPLGPNKPAPPASFLPVGAWPSRNATPITGDKKWLAEGGPGLPDDFNTAWFFAAHPDQRGAGQFAPGEEIAVVGMHPSKKEVRGCLPAVPPWCRIERVNPEGFMEAAPVALGLDTVWLFPDSEQGVGVWHGMVEVADDEGADVAALKAGFGPQPAELDPLPAQEAGPADPEPLPDEPPPPEREIETDDIEEDGDGDGEHGTPADILEPAEAEIDEVEAVEGELPVAALPETPEQQAIRELNEILDSFEKTPGIMEGGEELVAVNKLLAEHGMEPLTEDQYKHNIEAMLDEMRNFTGTLAEEVEAGRLSLPDALPAMRTETEAAALLSGRLSELGLDPGEAQSFAEQVFSPLGLTGEEPMSEMVSELMDMDWSTSPLTPDMLDNPLSYFPTNAENTAALDAICAEHFGGKTFEQLMNPADPTIPVPTTRSGMEAFIGNAGATAHAEILDAIYDDSGPLAQTVGEIRERAAEETPQKETPPKETTLKETTRRAAEPPQPSASSIPSVPVEENHPQETPELDFAADDDENFFSGDIFQDATE